MHKILKPCLAALALLAAGHPALRAADVLALSGPEIPPSALVIKTTTPLMTVRPENGALVVQAAPGAGTPTLFLASPAGSWNLSSFGHVEARITNTGDQPLAVHLRVDNKGRWQDQPWNTESQKIPPGKTVPVKVVFGYHYGFRPGYKLDPSAVSAIGIYIDTTKKTESFRVESVIAAGPAGETPPVDPRTVRIHPADGYLLGGAGMAFDPASQARTGPGATARLVSVSGQSALELSLDASAGEHYAALVPPMGAWDLSHSTDLRVKFTNTGKTPVLPSVTLVNGSKDQTTDTVSPGAPIPPGADVTLTVPYGVSRAWSGPSGDLSTAVGRRGVSGSKFASEKAAKIILRVTHQGAASLRIDSIRAVVIAQKLPAWVGHRPPVDGDWKLTLDDEFDGDRIDAKVWDVTGPNYWGQKKLTHWSRDNVIVADGLARIRLEKKKGWHNDDPASGHESDYAGGILRTYDKWTQRYGYFETRVKLPDKTGLWPAFWLMPDRGPSAGDLYKRESTGQDGMEFDIMEHLTRWGPYRYSVAMHWDGYGKTHKATGTGAYFHPDPDGFVTSGLLWLPGLAVYYVNGVEFARWKHDRVSSVPASILFTMPIGGWDNENHPVDAQLPADFVIDYVRVWQRADLLATP